MRFLAMLLLALSAQTAQADGGALSWLERMHAAAQKLSYTGTFMYHSGEQAETSRIVHLVGANGIQERLETLDGNPREIVRDGEEVKCYLPDRMTVKVDKQTDHKVFPQMLPKNLEDISAHYELVAGGSARVAGRDSQAIVLHPKDKLRYGRKLWADLKTGMLLKSQIFDEAGETIEQFAFTEIDIGGKIDQEQLKPKLLAKARVWHIENSAAVETNLAASGWGIQPELPGFKKVTEMRRTQGGSSQVGHAIYSDGVAAVSVFIEPMAGKTALPQPGLSRQGAINIYSRRIAGHVVTVVGEVPAASVKTLAEAVEYRRP
jgi:sigma-E factor negative regulatory protein RseB